MSVTERFSESYEQARGRFREAAAGHPAAGEQGALEVLDGFTIDWAWTGDADAARVQVFSTGLHGVEGYAGGAAVLEMLAAGDETPTLWLHALNPWGMAHWRRVNEENVDLNRNFLADDAAYEADDEAYGAFDGLLNPVRRAWIDPFLLRTALLILRHGMPALRNVVARGQYSFPRGLFFGGARRQATARRVLEHAVPWLEGRERVVWIDLHTGRGKPGEVVAFLDGVPSPATAARAERCFGDTLRAWEAGSADGYEMRGGMLPELARRCGPERFDALTVEFGTASDLGIIQAMRAENHVHFHGPGDTSGPRLRPTDPARRAMVEAFCPADPGWRQGVLDHARALQAQVQRMLAQ